MRGPTRGQPKQGLRRPPALYNSVLLVVIVILSLAAGLAPFPPEDLSRGEAAYGLLVVLFTAARILLPTLVLGLVYWLLLSGVVARTPGVGARIAAVVLAPIATSAFPLLALIDGGIPTQMGWAWAASSLVFGLLVRLPRAHEEGELFDLHR